MEAQQAPRSSKRKWDVGPEGDAGAGQVPVATAVPEAPVTFAQQTPAEAAALNASLAAAAASALPPGYQAAAGQLPQHFAQQQLAAGQQQLLPGQQVPQQGAVDRFVRLRGLPFTVGEPDVLAFLSGLTVEAVRFCLAAGGRFSGEAVVAFPSLEMATAAMQRDRTYLGHRYIEVYPATSDEFMHSAAELPQAAPAQSFTTAVVRMRGLPYSASTQEIVRFWAGFGLVRVAQVPLGTDGRPSGESYVEFQSADEASRAANARQRSLMGNRYVELYSATPEEMFTRAGEGRMVQAAALEDFPDAARGGAPGRFGPGGQESPPTGVVRLRGLPYQATAGDILRFFQGFGLARIMASTAPLHGRPSGEAYVEFVSAAEASRAVHQKQRCLLGQRYIELFHSQQQEMATQAALGQFVSEVAPDGNLHDAWSGGGGQAQAQGQYQPRGAYVPPAQPRPQPPGPRPEGDPGTVLLMRGLPFQSNVEDVINFFAGCGVVKVLPTTVPGGRPTGEAYVEFENPQSCDATLGTHQHGHIGTRYIELFPAPYGDMETAEQNPDLTATCARGGQLQATPSNVLMMRGLPFQANNDDIGAFFSGFELVKIVPVMPDDGRPNKGEAYVEFTSLEEKQRALQECQHKYVGTRYIQLFPGTPEELRRAAQRAAEADNWYAERNANHAPRPSRNGDPNQDAPALRMRGLPFDATVEDIFYFFDGFGPLRVVPITSQFNGRPSGEAIVEFHSTEDAEFAKHARHKAMMGTRWIELYPASPEDLCMVDGGGGGPPFKAPRRSFGRSENREWPAGPSPPPPTPPPPPTRW